MRTRKRTQLRLLLRCAALCPQVIELQTGGTGFAARDGDKVQTSKFFEMGVGNGRRDLRGQHTQGRSLAGLVFNN